MTKILQNVFHNYFTTIGADLASKFDSNPNNGNNLGNDSGENILQSSKDQSDFNFYSISAEYVFDQNCNLPNDKSPGLDDCYVKLLKTPALIICNSLAYVCNLSLATSVFPSEWKNVQSCTYFQIW